jgi:hypothetical protein
MGSSLVYATPLTAHQLTNGLRNIADSISLPAFKYQGDLVRNLEIEAKEESANYCFNCYYLIAIKGDPSVQEEVVVVRDETPLTIQEEKIVDSYLDPNDVETFIYYAGMNTNFNVTVDVIYGTVKVTIRDLKSGSANNVLKEQNVSYGYANIGVTNGANIRSNIPTNSLDQ